MGWGKCQISMEYSKRYVGHLKNWESNAEGTEITESWETAGAGPQDARGAASLALEQFVGVG